MFCVKVIHRLSSLENKGRTGIFSVFISLRIFALSLRIFALSLRIFAFIPTYFCFYPYVFLLLSLRIFLLRRDIL